MRKQRQQTCDNCGREFSTWADMWGYVCPYCDYNNATKRNPVRHYWQYATPWAYFIDAKSYDVSAATEVDIREREQQESRG